MKNEDDMSDVAERCQRVGYIIKSMAEDPAFEQDAQMAKKIADLQLYVANHLS